MYHVGPSDGAVSHYKLRLKIYMVLGVCRTLQLCSSYAQVCSPAAPLLESAVLQLLYSSLQICSSFTRVCSSAAPLLESTVLQFLYSSVQFCSSFTGVYSSAVLLLESAVLQLLYLSLQFCSCYTRTCRYFLLFQINLTFLKRKIGSIFVPSSLMRSCEFRLMSFFIPALGVICQ